MSRVEKITSQEPIKKTSDEIVQTFDVRSSRRGGSCVVFGVGAVVLLIFFWLGVVAATGLVSVPIFSTLFFREAASAQTITPGTPIEHKIASDILSEVMKKTEQGAQTWQGKTFTLALSQEDLTASLQSQLGRQKSEFLDEKQAQLSVLPENAIALFLPIRWNQRETTLAVWFLVSVQDEGLALQMTRVRLGNLPLPLSAIAPLSRAFMTRTLGALNQSLRSYLHVQSVETREGILRVTGTLAADIVF